MVYHIWTSSLYFWICKKSRFALGVKGLKKVLRDMPLGASIICATACVKNLIIIGNCAVFYVTTVIEFSVVQFQ